MRTTWIHLVISGSGRRSVAQELMVMNSKRMLHLHVSRSILCQKTNRYCANICFGILVTNLTSMTSSVNGHNLHLHSAILTPAELDIKRVAAFRFDPIAQTS